MHEPTHHDSKQQDPITRFADYLRARKISPIVVGLSLTLLVWALIAGLVYWNVSRSTRPETSTTPTEQEQTPEVTAYRRAIDGTVVETEAEQQPVAYAVMISNITEARPAAGLSQARIVFELPVEMGLTRFLAVFTNDQDVPKIGSVRSARPYAIDLASEFGGAYVHVGGSPDALNIIQNTKGLLNVDEFASSNVIFRAKNRVAPHNAYTSSDLMKELITAKSVTRTFGTVAPWLYKEETPAEERVGNAGVLVNYSTYQYEAEWKYEEASNDYIRYQARVRHKDEEGVEIRAKNVAVMVAPAKVLDTAGRLDMPVIGTGKAWVFREGVMVEGTWKKDSAVERLRFFDADGGEVSFIPGTTWVEVVQDAGKVKLK